MQENREKFAYIKKFLYLCREFWKKEKTCEKMKAKWTSLVDDLQEVLTKNTMHGISQETENGVLCDYVRHEVSVALKKGEIPTI